jgi:hypothetical protein
MRTAGISNWRVTTIWSARDEGFQLSLSNIPERNSLFGIARLAQSSRKPKVIDPLPDPLQLYRRSARLAIYWIQSIETFESRGKEFSGIRFSPALK